MRRGRGAGGGWRGGQKNVGRGRDPRRRSTIFGLWKKNVERAADCARRSTFFGMGAVDADIAVPADRALEAACAAARGASEKL
jgi:hypothetical protein